MQCVYIYHTKQMVLLLCSVVQFIFSMVVYVHITHADVTQEVASCGMALVYDMSEPSQKEALVGALVGTLLEGRKYVCVSYTAWLSYNLACMCIH